MRNTNVLQMIGTGLNGVNDAQPGGGASPGFAPGQLGKTYEFSAADVPYVSTVATLYGGRYQYVQTKAGSTIAPARGLVCFWDPATPGGYVVTPDDPGGGADIAGIYISAPTKGNYCFIQVAGVVGMQAVASLARAEGIGDVLVVGAGSAVDNIDNNDPQDGNTINGIVGIAIELPVDATITLARIWPVREHF
jgi:hypothetical protein